MNKIFILAGILIILGIIFIIDIVLSHKGIHNSKLSLGIIIITVLLVSIMQII